MSRYNGHVAKHLEAVYERGVLRPLEYLSLAENQHVRLTIEGYRGKNGSVELEIFGAECRKAMAWLAKESAAYAGQWVALAVSRLVAQTWRKVFI